jgi:hypothetical protein
VWDNALSTPNFSAMANVSEALNGVTYTRLPLRTGRAFLWIGRLGQKYLHSCRYGFNWDHFEQSSAFPSVLIQSSLVVSSGMFLSSPISSQSVPSHSPQSILPAEGLQHLTSNSLLLLYLPSSVGATEEPSRRDSALVDFKRCFGVYHCDQGSE